MEKNLNVLSKMAYDCACKHGFHNKVYNYDYWFMLFITEISEAVDADRKGKYSIDKSLMGYYSSWIISDNRFKENYDQLIKGTVEEEFADAIIRLLDFSGLENIQLINDIESFVNSLNDISFNILKNSNFIQNSYLVCARVFDRNIDMETKVNSLIGIIFQWAKVLNIDLLQHIEWKMKYNELRPMLNGKKY